MTRVAAALPAAAIVLLLLSLGWFRGPTLDASVFAVIANELRAGAMPYRDLFDHKPPGIYLVEAVLGTVLPFVDAWTRAWLLSTVTTLATLGLLAWHLDPRVGRVATALGLLAVGPLYGADVVVFGGGYTEPVAMLPTLIGVLLATRRGDRAAIGAGLALSVAATVSLQVAAPILAVLVVLAAQRRWRDLVVLSVVGGGVAAVVAAWLWWAGALPTAVDALIVYNRAYAEGRDILGIVPVTYAARVTLLLAAALAALVIRLVLARRQPLAIDERIAVVWLGLTVAYLWVQGFFFPHYLLIAAPAITLLACGGVAQAARSVTTPRARLWATFVAGMAFIPSLLILAAFERPVTRIPEIGQTATVIRAETRPEDRIFVWGAEPELYLASDRRPGGRYLSLLALTQPHYSSPEVVGRFLAELQAAPPALIVDASYNPSRVGTVPLLGPSGYGPNPPFSDAGYLDPIRDWVASTYRRVDPGSAWPVYVLASSG